MTAAARAPAEHDLVRQMAPQAAAVILSAADHRDTSRSGRAVLDLAFPDPASGSSIRRQNLSCALGDAGRLGCALQDRVHREVGKGRDSDGRVPLEAFVRRLDGQAPLAWNVAEHVEETDAADARFVRVECGNVVQGKPALLEVDADISDLDDWA